VGVELGKASIKTRESRSGQHNAKEFRRGSFSAKTGPIQLPADVRFTLKAT
jgi:hypothetical protein